MIAATVVGAVVLATAVEPSSSAHGTFAGSLGDTLVGWSFVATGLVAWCYRPMNRSGVLMIAVGFFWFAGNLRWISNCKDPLTWTAGWAFVGVYAALLLHLLLAFPEGRLRTTIDRILVGAAYVDVTVVALVLEMVHRPTGFGCQAQVPSGLNLLLIHPNPGLYNSGQTIRTGVNVVFAIAIGWILLRRWRFASPSARRLMTPVLAAGGGAALAVTIGSPEEYASWANGPLVSNLLTLTRDAGLAAIPFGFLAGLLRTGAQKSVVGELVISLGKQPTPEGVRRALADALGDPSLTVGYWVPSQGTYVDESGHPLSTSDPGSTQASTRLDRGGQPIAMLVHDPALLQTPRLIEAVSAAAAMSLENERLHAEVRAQLEQVRASRARLVEAADAERRRLERDLHDGAQQRLVSLGLSLQIAQAQLTSQSQDRLAATLSDASDQIRMAMSELRDLARGIHPAVLTEEGLASAIEGLVERSTVPVMLSLSGVGRLPPPVEAAGYFVVSESLANVAKHGAASSAKVVIECCNGSLSVSVTDDGAGGADPAAGSGLRGLEDRVAALGGVLTVESRMGQGTRIHAEIPCAS